MRRDQNRDLLFAQCPQALEKFGFAANVEVGGWFVEKQYPRLPDEHARKADCLLLAA